MCVTDWGRCQLEAPPSTAVTESGGRRRSTIWKPNLRRLEVSVSNCNVSYRAPGRTWTREKPRSWRKLSPRSKTSHWRVTTIGCPPIVYHGTDIGDARPIRQPPLWLPLTNQAEVNEMLKDMKEREVIEQSESSVCVRRVFPKEERRPSFLSGLQEAEWHDQEGLLPAPRIDDTLHTIAGAKWLSTLDLNSGYWRVDLHPDDKGKTALSRRCSNYSYALQPL
jgi:hypothetical protein